MLNAREVDEFKAPRSRMRGAFLFRNTCWKRRTQQSRRPWITGGFAFVPDQYVGGIHRGCRTGV